MTLPLLLVFGALLFCIGLATVLTRRHALQMLIGVELMFGAAGVNFIAFWRWSPQLHGFQNNDGPLFALVGLALGAGLALVGVALILQAWRAFHSADADAADRLPK